MLMSSIFAALRLSAYARRSRSLFSRRLPPGPARLSSPPAEAAGVDTIARVHPTARGPDGKPLFIDSAALGPRDARKALLLISRHPWVEGYFGSARPDRLLREGVAPPRMPALLLVHALNPLRLCLEPARQRRQCRSQPQFRRSCIGHPTIRLPPMPCAGRVSRRAFARAIARANGLLPPMPQHMARRRCKRPSAAASTVSQGAFFRRRGAKLVARCCGPSWPKIWRGSESWWRSISIPGWARRAAGEMIVEELPAARATPARNKDVGRPGHLRRCGGFGVRRW